MLYRDNVIVFCGIVSSISASRANSVHRIMADVLRDSSELPSGLYRAVFLQRLIYLIYFTLAHLLYLHFSLSHIHTCTNTPTHIF